MFKILTILNLDMVQIEKIEWELISDGVYCNELIPGAGDEIFKIQPGATSQTAMTSTTLVSLICLKMYLIQFYVFLEMPYFVWRSFIQH